MASLSPGSALRSWREQQNISQQEAASRAGVTQAAWSDWEQDRKRPRVQHALRLERITAGVVSVLMWADADPLPATGTEG